MNAAEVDRAIPHLIQLGWLPDALGSSDVPVATPGHGGCLLKLLAGHTQTSAEIKRRARELSGLGYTLRDVWSSHGNYLEPTSESHLVFGHQRFFLPDVRFATIACSQLGRDGRRLPNWPRLLEFCAQTLARDGWTLLIPDNTTLADATWQLARQANIPHSRVKIPSAKQTCVRWLSSVLRADPNDEAELQLSPAFEQSRKEKAALQDRFAIAFAERLVVLYVRPKGNLVDLIERRLKRNHETKKTPSVRILISPSHREKKGDGPEIRNSTHDTLLSQGAVGWYVAPSDDSVESLSLPCHQRFVDRPVHQPIMKIESFARGFGSDWPFLTHCTRGSLQLAPDESKGNTQLRNWLEGYQQSFSPLDMLCRIANQKLLLGSNKTKRTQYRSVSLSACRLPELLARRTFRSHLGRWDWEPYGVIIRRANLESMGANPVRYGDEDEFQRLPDETKSFFQPRGKSRQWEQEQEWRLLGDLPLTTIPPDNMFLFCATKTQAIKLASQFPWTILYLA